MNAPGFVGRCGKRKREQSGETRSVEDMVAKSHGQSVQKDLVEAGNRLAARI